MSVEVTQYGGFCGVGDASPIIPPSSGLGDSSPIIPPSSGVGDGYPIIPPIQKFPLLSNQLDRGNLVDYCFVENIQFGRRFF